MTATSFNAFIEECTDLEAVEIRTTSHYALAPDVYGLADGYAWAFAEASDADSRARHHLSDGGEWPYYIAATPTTPDMLDRYSLATPSDMRTAADLEAVAEKRVLETYCEGDLTAYIFDTAEDCAEAVTRWQENGHERVARIMDENATGRNGLGHDGSDETLVSALVDRLKESGDRTQHPESGDDGEILDALGGLLEEHYWGEWDSLAGYVQEREESGTPYDQQSTRYWGYIDWERMADDERGDYYTYPATNGNVHIFDAI